MDKTSSDALLKDMGSVFRITKGSALQWPWYESSLPPFNHYYCPTC